MSEIKLKACPFCGGEAVAYRDNYGKILIACNNCKLYLGIELEDGVVLEDGWRATFASAEEAAEVWNRRVDNG